VVVVAVASYNTVPAPWQRTEVAPNVKTGVPTVAVVVTICVAVVGPLQPAAETVIVEVPDQPAT